MGAPYYNLRSKLNRAIVAYLISKQAGNTADTIVATSTLPRTFPNTTVQSVQAIEDPPFSGNQRITVYIIIKGSATAADGQTNPELQRVQFDQRVALVNDALRQTDNGQNLNATAVDITAAGRALAVDPSNGTNPVQVLQAQNNADMKDFTVNGWFPHGSADGEIAETEGFDWKDIWIYEAVCCPANVD